MKKQVRHQMEWERGARRVKLGRETSTHSVNMLCWSWKEIRFWKDVYSYFYAYAQIGKQQLEAGAVVAQTNADY